MSSAQAELFGDAQDARAEHPDYLSRQLITCLGNKRALLAPIGSAVEVVKQRLGKPRLAVVDAFAGSGVVSRFFKRHAERLVTNDLEDYAAVAARAFLGDRSAREQARLAEAAAALSEEVEADEVSDPGFFERLYAPRDDARITKSDRVFYSRKNARRLDGYRPRLERLPLDRIQKLHPTEDASWLGRQSGENFKLGRR